ncbi:peptidyl-prolyl cis-trans isomerase [bacterium]|nr:peptidyl-prolyl cis-trans isomerase [bacterium]
MKKIVCILCWILAAYCIYFPFSHFYTDADKREVKISHILVDTEDMAKELKTKLDEDSSKFEELVEEYSQCPSKENKGYLGFYDRGRLPIEMEKAAFKMDVNDISNPIESKQGWHIIRIDDITYFSSKENFK